MIGVNDFVNALGGNGLEETPGQRIARLRKQAKLTQEQLAEAVGTHKNTVSKWETDEQGLSGENQIAVARALGVTVETLTGVTDNSVSRATPPDPYQQAWRGIVDLLANDPGRLKKLIAVLSSEEFRRLLDGT